MTARTPANLTRGLGNLTLFCGRHFTLMRSLSWSAGDDIDRSPQFAAALTTASDTVHNLAELGAKVVAYADGEIYGTALLEQCRHMIGALKHAETANRLTPIPTLDFEWDNARAAIEEIASELEAAGFDGQDETDAEKFQRTIADVTARFGKPGSTT